MNWWARYEEVEHALEITSESVIGMHARVTTSEGLNDCLYSGLVVVWERRFFWFSAGHVMADLRRAHEDPGTHDISLRLVDNFGREGAESIPFHAPAAHFLTLEVLGFDVGLVPLDDVTVRNLAANPKFQPFQLDRWVSPEINERRGVYTSGFPHHLNRSRVLSRASRRISERVESVSETRWLRPALACLPLSRPLHQSRLKASGLKPIEGTQVCRILVPREEVSDVSGLSGGPVWVARRERRARWLHLWGLQVSWNEETRHVRVLTFERVYGELAAALERGRRQ